MFDEALGEQEYLERNLSAESLDSDDLEGDMNMSDEDDTGKKRAHIKVQQQINRDRKGKNPANKYHQEADTNVF